MQRGESAKGVLERFSNNETVHKAPGIKLKLLVMLIVSNAGPAFCAISRINWKTLAVTNRSRSSDDVGHVCVCMCVCIVPRNVISRTANAVAIWVVHICVHTRPKESR